MRKKNKNIISIKDYKIIIKYKNEHIIKNISFNEFENIQNLDESKIECEEW